MRVNFNYLIPAQNIPFESKKAQKLIERVQNAERLDKLQISFDELKSMYKEIGYDVLYKRGSHAIVPISKDLNIPVVIPHKTKNVHLFDLKRFIYILHGEFEKARLCN